MATVSVMEELITVANGTTLCIESYGDPAAPLALQLEGHMAQLVSTPEGFCRELADRGLGVVRVDNRDVGRSTRFPGATYRLDDMVEDIHGLIAVLGGGPALVCGRSMGGMIAQLLAVRYPADVAGLGLFFTTARTGRPVPRPGEVPTAAAAGYPVPADEAQFVAWELDQLPGIAGPRFPFPRGYVEHLAHAMWARGVDPDGWARQGYAIAATPDWSHRLAAIDVPAVVVHGDADPIIPVDRGLDLHERLTDSVLHIVPGMGHQQPEELDTWFADVVVELAGRTDRAVSM